MEESRQNQSLQKPKSEVLQPYARHDEYLEDLAKVLAEDYGVTYNSDELKVVAGNLDNFLSTFL